MSKKSFTVTLLALCLMVVPFAALAQTEGIPLQKDVILGAPIYGPQDLPEEITFALYDVQNGLNPLGKQTFPRGQYTVDFEFSQSNGVTGGNVARVKADFTSILNLKDASGQTLKPKEIWAALEVGGTEVGGRTKVPDETLVRLLLNSDASLATYLTLAYEGDGNPIATIYKDLPISLTAADGTKKTLSDYFSGVVAGSAGVTPVVGSTTDPYWERVGGYLYYNNGNVGIGTTAPNYAKLQLKGSTSDINGWATYMTDANGGLLFGVRNDSYLQFGNSNVGGQFFFVGKNGVSYSYFFSNKLGNYLSIQSNKAGSSVFAIDSNGKVGIGTTNPGTYALAVEGKIGCRELTVTTGAWADFVFKDNYRLPTLFEVEQHIKEKGHLPGIPTEGEVKEKGVSVGEVSSKLLQKIEELTLYVIDINKENAALKAKLASLEEQLEEIKN